MWKSFSYARALKKHINAVHRDQTNEKQVEETNENLISKIHRKKFKCDSFGKSFSYAAVLKKHVNAIHRDQKVKNH